MAECSVRDDELIVTLSAVEKLEAIHGDVVVPLSSVLSVEIIEQPLHYIHGIRVGTGIPGLTAVGTFTTKSTKIFGVIHHGQHRGVRIVLTGAQFDEIILGDVDPESTTARISTRA